MGTNGTPLVSRVEAYIYVYRYAREGRVGWCSRKFKSRIVKGG